MNQFLSLVVLLLVCLAFGECASSTAFDNSLKPQEETVLVSKAQKSVADIISKATGKIKKSKTKQAAVTDPEARTTGAN
jgi:hypothetical protein